MVPSVRVFMDGAFDVMHFGHMNAFRLGRSLGTELVVGVNSSASIAACKCEPLMSDAERVAMVASCKFVDEVIENVPYVMDAAYVEYLVREHKIDWIVHGDDECVVDGVDAYEAAKSLGRFQTIPRTQDISTTDLVGRMLCLSKPGPLSLGALERAFASGRCPSGKVVYVCGGFDLFHSGHVDMLADARAKGDYLLVGVHADAVLAAPPLMTSRERALSVLGCRHADDVVVDAPLVVDDTLLDSFNVAIVVIAGGEGGGEAYAIPRRRGMLVEITTPPGRLTTSEIKRRVAQRTDALVARYAVKTSKQQQRPCVSPARHFDFPVVATCP
ncbi:hypothetical protein CTAYLR_003583 [Chrysophaeum taylorii]|uniref:ethanolamine-phosphate cytidylyltransferase n=1 Tax=Chrysophaeum taylorii TaxID=2483200 RepID=A0AAD7UMK2_9STRA|nr:hypothetical protein CTAYLR_003583 [Chrysophaeum taylorii]